MVYDAENATVLFAGAQVRFIHLSLLITGGFGATFNCYELALSQAPVFRNSPLMIRKALMKRWSV